MATFGNWWLFLKVPRVLSIKFDLITVQNFQEQVYTYDGNERFLALFRAKFWKIKIKNLVMVYIFFVGNNKVPPKFNEI